MLNFCGLLFHRTCFFAILAVWPSNQAPSIHFADKTYNVTTVRATATNSSVGAGQTIYASASVKSYYIDAAPDSDLMDPGIDLEAMSTTTTLNPLRSGNYSNGRILIDLNSYYARNEKDKFEGPKSKMIGQECESSDQCPEGAICTDNLGIGETLCFCKRGGPSNYPDGRQYCDNFVVVSREHGYNKTIIYRNSDD